MEIENEDQAQTDEVVGIAAEPTGEMNQAGSYSYSRDHIVDRTGELLSSAVGVAEELGRPVVVAVTDPRDGTMAPVVLSRAGAAPLPASSFDAYRERPLAREGTALHTRLSSFIAHTNRFKTRHSAIFAFDDMARPSLTTIFDYHPSEQAVAHDWPATDNCRHRASYAFPLSEEWKAWHENDGQKMAMPDFAAFLEDHIVDVTPDNDPTGPQAEAFIRSVDGKMASPSKLMEIARGLQINESSTVREVRNLSSGEAEVVFASEHSDASGAPLKLPNLFMICIPIFARSEEYYRLIARFRYRKTPGGIVFWYELWRPDLVFEMAFSEACSTAADATDLPLYVGVSETMG